MTDKNEILRQINTLRNKKSPNGSNRRGNAAINAKIRGLTMRLKGGRRHKRSNRTRRHR